MTIASHTLAKNGMPFIGLVLEQVAPLMDKMFITISQYSDDGTMDEIQKFIGKHPDKLIEFGLEGNTNPAKLTNVRNTQIRATKQDWILHLDDDDFWPIDQLDGVLNELDKDSEILAYSVNPFQVIDENTQDSTWRKKQFSKFQKNVGGLHCVGDWPRELPSDAEGRPLYHKTHPKVKVLSYKFYHLSYLKKWSFRKEKWAQGKFPLEIGQGIPYDKPFPEQLKQIIVGNRSGVS